MGLCKQFTFSKKVILSCLSNVSKLTVCMLTAIDSRMKIGISKLHVSFTADHSMAVDLLLVNCLLLLSLFVQILCLAFCNTMHKVLGLL